MKKILNIIIGLFGGIDIHYEEVWHPSNKEGERGKYVIKNFKPNKEKLVVYFKHNPQTRREDI